MAILIKHSKSKMCCVCAPPRRVPTSIIENTLYFVMESYSSMCVCVGSSSIIGFSGRKHAEWFIAHKPIDIGISLWVFGKSCGMNELHFFTKRYMYNFGGP